MKGALGRNAIGWMKIYFNLNCEVMPTSGRLHLSDNYTRREVYDSYRSDMISTSDKYVTYSQFTRLWSTQFTNVVIPRKVRMGYCSICANLKSMAKGAKTTKEKDIHKKAYRTIEKHNHWNGRNPCTIERSRRRNRSNICG